MGRGHIPTVDGGITRRLARRAARSPWSLWRELRHRDDPQDGVLDVGDQARGLDCPSTPTQSDEPPSGRCREGRFRATRPGRGHKDSSYYSPTLASGEPAARLSLFASAAMVGIGAALGQRLIDMAPRRVRGAVPNGGLPRETFTAAVATDQGAQRETRRAIVGPARNGHDAARRNVRTGRFVPPESGFVLETRGRCPLPYGGDSYMDERRRRHDLAHSRSSSACIRVDSGLSAQDLKITSLESSQRADQPVRTQQTGPSDRAVSGSRRGTCRRCCPAR